MFEEPGTWSVMLGKERLVSGLATSAEAWAFIDRREVHSLRFTNRTATRAGAFTIKRE
jgi:hypothetical protein